MILSALIESIDYSNNTCQVQIPDLRSAANKEPIIRTAVFAETPGIHNSYSIGDTVWLAFVRNEKQYPVVIGRLINPKTYTDVPVGSVSGNSLYIEQKAVLPADTTFQISESGYDSLTNIINKLKAATNFIESNHDLDARLKNAGSGNGTSDYDHSLLEEALFSTITLSQNKDAFEREFPVGRVLYVQNDLGKQYPLWTEISVYPVQSLAADILEFSNSNIDKRYQALPGIWKIKTALNGALLVQRCLPNYNSIPSYVNIEVNGAGQRCVLFDDDGDALCYYWELDDEVGTPTTLRHIKTKDLVFKTGNGKLMKEDNSKEILSISLPNGGDMLKNFSNTESVKDLIAILNLRGVDLTNKKAEQCRLHATNQHGLFAHSRALEYIYLNDNYNSNVLNTWLFYQATNLKEVYIPDSIETITRGVFNGTINLSSILNLENSHIVQIDQEAFQNGGCNRLYLPRKVDVVNFGARSIGNHNNNDQSRGKHIVSLFVHSRLKLNAECFWNYSNGKNNFLNLYTMELIYSGTKDEVKRLIAESDLLAFFKYPLEPALTQIPSNLDDYMIDGSSGYRIGSATKPTIVYNYKR